MHQTPAGTRLVSLGKKRDGLRGPRWPFLPLGSLDLNLGLPWGSLVLAS